MCREEASADEQAVIQEDSRGCDLGPDPLLRVQGSLVEVEFEVEFESDVACPSWRPQRYVDFDVEKRAELMSRYVGGDGGDGGEGGDGGAAPEDASKKGRGRGSALATRGAAGGSGTGTGTGGS